MERFTSADPSTGGPRLRVKTGKARPPVRSMVGRGFGPAAELPLGAVQLKKQLHGLTLPLERRSVDRRQHGSGWTSDRALGTIFGGRVPPLSFFR